MTRCGGHSCLKLACFQDFSCHFDHGEKSLLTSPELITHSCVSRKGFFSPRCSDQNDNVRRPFLSKCVLSSRHFMSFRPWGGIPADFAGIDHPFLCESSGILPPPFVRFQNDKVRGHSLYLQGLEEQFHVRCQMAYAFQFS